MSKLTILGCSLLMFSTQIAVADSWIGDRETGCEIWASDLDTANATITWSGGCDSNNKAAGIGDLVWTEGDAELGVYKGEMQGGKFHGEGELKFRDSADQKFTIVNF